MTDTLGDIAVKVRLQIEDTDFRDIENSAKKVGDKIGKSISDAFGDANKSAKDVSKNLDSAAESANKLKEAASGASTEMQETKQAADDTKKSLDDVGKTDRWDSAEKGISGFKRGLRDISQYAGMAAIAVSSIPGALNDSQKAWVGMGVAALGATQIVLELSDAVTDIRKGWQGFVSLLKSFDLMSIATNPYVIALTAIAAALVVVELKTGAISKTANAAFAVLTRDAEKAADNIGKAWKQLDTFWASLSRGGTGQTDTEKRLKSLVDTFNSIATNPLVSALAPQMQFVSDVLKELTGESAKAAEAQAKLKAEIEGVSKAIDDNIKSVSDAVSQYDELAGAVNNLIGEQADSKTAGIKQLDASVDLEKAQKDYDDTLKKSSSTVQKYWKEVQDGKITAEQAYAAIKKQTNGSQEQLAAFQNLAHSSAALTNAQRDYAAATIEAETAQGQLENATADANIALSKQGSNADAAKTGLSGWVSMLKEGLQAIKDIKTEAAKEIVVQVRYRELIEGGVPSNGLASSIASGNYSIISGSQVSQYYANSPYGGTSIAGAGPRSNYDTGGVSRLSDAGSVISGMAPVLTNPYSGTGPTTYSATPTATPYNLGMGTVVKAGEAISSQLKKTIESSASPSIGTWISSGVSSSMSKISGAAQLAASKFSSYFPHSPAQAGPLKEYPKFGDWIKTGMYRDIRNVEGVAEEYAKKLSTAVNNAVMKAFGTDWSSYASGSAASTTGGSAASSGSSLIGRLVNVLSGVSSTSVDKNQYGDTLYGGMGWSSNKGPTYGGGWTSGDTSSCVFGGSGGLGGGFGTSSDPMNVVVVDPMGREYFTQTNPAWCDPTIMAVSDVTMSPDYINAIVTSLGGKAAPLIGKTDATAPAASSGSGASVNTNIQVGSGAAVIVNNPSGSGSTAKDSPGSLAQAQASIASVPTAASAAVAGSTAASMASWTTYFTGSAHKSLSVNTVSQVLQDLGYGDLPDFAKTAVKNMAYEYVHGGVDEGELGYSTRVQLQAGNVAKYGFGGDTAKTDALLDSFFMKWSGGMGTGKGLSKSADLVASGAAANLADNTSIVSKSMPATIAVGNLADATYGQGTAAKTTTVALTGASKALASWGADAKQFSEDMGQHWNQVLKDFGVAAVGTISAVSSMFGGNYYGGISGGGISGGGYSGGGTALDASGGSSAAGGAYVSILTDIRNAVSSAKQSITVNQSNNFAGSKFTPDFTPAQVISQANWSAQLAATKFGR